MMKRCLMIDLCLACGAILLVVLALAATAYCVVNDVIPAPKCVDGRGLKNGQRDDGYLFYCGMNRSPQTGRCMDNALNAKCDTENPYCICRNATIAQAGSGNYCGCEIP